MTPNFLPYGGTVLLIGRPTQFQSVVAFDLAATVALGGASVVYLVADHAEESGLADRLIAWRAVRQIETGKRLHVVAAKAHGVSGRALVDRVHDAVGSKLPRLVVRDFSTRMQPLDGSDPWLADAAPLAEALRCPVLSVGHCGPIAQPDMTAADEIFWCSTFHDKVRLSNCNVKLERLKPLTVGEPIELNGHEFPGAIIFDRAEDAEPVNAAAE